MKKESQQQHPAPETLRADFKDFVLRLDEAERIAENLAQDEASLRESGPGKTRRILRIAAVAASLALVAGLGAGLASRLSAPKDTFDDPYLAYAAVEDALNRISAQAGKGLALERQGEAKLQESFSVFHR